MEFIALSNDSVSLQPMLPTDYDDLFRVASDPKIWEGHPDFLRYTAEGFATYFEKLCKTNMPYLIRDSSTQSIMGATSFYQYNEEHNSIAIGYTFLATAYWGGYINRKVKALMIDHAFKFVDTIIFHVREHNYRSQGALTKIGAVKMSEYPAPADSSSVQFEYALTKERWQST